MKLIPPPEAFVREALIVLGGAVLAALILSQVPQLRDWINRSTKGCDCQG